MKESIGIDFSRIALKERRTKIVATLGPASNSKTQIASLIGAGVNVFRLNFSHGSHSDHGKSYRRIREVAAEAKATVAILADLCGPKIRCGHFENGSIELTAGDPVTITVREVMGKPGLIPSEYRELAKDLKVGDRVLMADGTRELSVERVDGEDIHCRVVVGGKLSDRKGINLPGVAISTPSLTQKDKKDAHFAASLGVDYLALSFVRSAADVRELKALLQQVGKEIPVVSKIEKPEALEDIASILQETDAIMVARGDLGVELPAEQVPIIQQELIRLAIEHNRQVIVATQMLESMIENPTPTRAEVTDVAWAAMAGADAVMLSGETAVGQFPVEAVATMDRVLRLVESNQWQRDQFAHLIDHTTLATQEPTVALQLVEALSRATSKLSRDLSSRAICVHTQTGFTARMIAAERPSAPILAFGCSPSTAQRLALVWGICPVQESTGEVNPIEETRKIVKAKGLAVDGDFTLLVSRGCDDPRGHAPAIRIVAV